MEINVSGPVQGHLHPLADGRRAVAAPTAAAQAPGVEAVQAPGPAPEAADVQQAVEDINRHMQALARGLEFTVDTDTRRSVVRVVDLQTGELIRQIPTPEVLSMAKKLDQMLGVLIRQQA